MKKLDLEKKALKYSTIVGSVAAFAGTANSQIVYTDVNPDETYTEDQLYMLDMDNDLTPDFGIVQFDTVITYAYTNFYNEGVVLLTMGSNGAISTAGSFATYLKALNLNDPIDNTQTFDASTSTTPLIAGAYITSALANQGIGPWIDGADHYMGVTFLIGANMHFGWARFSETTDGLSFTIKDYAYETTPGGSILAGQTFNSINENVADAVSMQVINNSVMINVLNTEFTNGTVQVLNTAGQVVFSSKLNGNQTINLDGYASGVYMVQVAFDQGAVNHKLFVR